MSAMNGRQGFHTIRVNQHFSKKTLHIRINSGSIHNFLDRDLARKLGCGLETIEAQSMIGADGN